MNAARFSIAATVCTLLCAPAVCAAVAELEQPVKNGGSVTWGAIPMPPDDVSEPDLKALVEWILATK